MVHPAAVRYNSVSGDDRFDNLNYNIRYNSDFASHETLMEDQLVPLDLSGRRIALPLQPLPKLQPKSKVRLTKEQLAPLHRIYAKDVAYRYMYSSAPLPEYNPFQAVHPTLAPTQFHRYNHIQPQQQHQLHMQQEHQLHKQKLQPKTTYRGIPLDPASMLSGSPAYAATSSRSSSESNQVPVSGFDHNFSKPANYPYYNRTLDGRITGRTYGGVDTSGNHLSGGPSRPELTTTCTTTTTDDHHHQLQQQGDPDRDHLLQQLQLKLHQLHKQNIQPKAAYGGIPLDPESMLSSTPTYAATSSKSESESNHFPVSGFEKRFFKPTKDFGYPYYDGMLDGRVTGGAYGGVDTGDHRADCPPPKQKLQPKTTYGGIPLDNASTLSGSPAYAATSSPSSSESNHVRFSGFDSSFSKPAYGFGYPYYNRTLDGRITGGTYGDVDTSGNHLSDCPPTELRTTCTTTTGDHGLTPEQPQYDKKCVMKRQKNESTKRSQDAKRQKYVENQVKYLTKTASEMKDIKKGLLKDNNDLLAE